MTLKQNQPTFAYSRATAGRFELATRIARAERRLLLRELQRVGIQIVDWQVSQPLDQVIRMSLGRLPQNRAVGIVP